MVDPPPDLVIEIEVTRSSIAKLPVYAAMGVPEIWRWDGQRVTILGLVDDDYVERKTSAALPPLTSDVATRFLVKSRELRRTIWVRQVREWARAAGTT